ncbi:MAG: hypothetical protein JXP39_02950 [Spirochaetales bacterium]|nr:hypothetical protein [Spirochaetales bacterium]
MNETDVCCPQFDPAPWDGITHEWKNKPFIVDSIPQFLHIPLPGAMDRMMKRLMKKAGDFGIAPDPKAYLLLSRDTSPWKSVYYYGVSRELPEAETVTLSGKFMSRAFDGPYSKVPLFIKEMEKSVKAEDRTALNYYCFYTTCPKCAIKYGHNYIVVIAEVVE